MKDDSGGKKDGAPGRIRTSDHLVRSQVLYPAELRAHIVYILLASFKDKMCRLNIYHQDLNVIFI